MIPQLAMASQQTSGFAQRVATGVPAGGTVLPDLKALDQHIGDTRTAELNPTARVVAQMQGTTREFIAISAYEGCTDVITGANIGVQTPIFTSVMNDDYGRPVAGSAKQGQDLYANQSTPGNLIVTGTKNTGKVAFLSGLFAGDGAAVDPYGTFNFTDPVTGKSYSARTKADSIQQQPRVRAVISDGLLFGPASGTPNVGKPIMVNLADKMGLQFVDDGNGGKAVAAWPDLTSLGFNDTGQLQSLLGQGGNGSEHFKAGDGIFFSPGLPPSDAPTLTLVSGSGLVANQSYDYAYAYTTTVGATALSPVASITPTGTTRQVQVDISAAPTGAAGTGIWLVRRPSPQTGVTPSPWKLVIAYATDITAPSSYTDSTPSTGLGAVFTDSPTSIGVLLDASTTAPATGGPSAAAALHGYPKDVWNISALKYVTLPDARVALALNYSAVDFKLGPTGDLELQAAGGGSSSTVAFGTGSNEVDSFLIATSAGEYLTWTAGTEIDHGGWHTAGTDGATGDIVFPVGGLFKVDVHVDGDASPAVALTGQYSIQLEVNGTIVYAQNQDVPNASDFVGILAKQYDFAAGDTLRIRISNYAGSGSFLIDGGNIDIHKV